MTGNENVTDTLTSGLCNLDCIENDLWLGDLSAASDLRIIKEKKIHSIVTVNSFPLPKKIIDANGIHNHFIRALDTPRDDLLSHFEDTFQFIENGLNLGGVLIHCYLGISRSATIVLAYIMKKKSMTLKAALKYVKSKRPSIGPNLGFLAQLKLYEIMHWTINKNNLQYKMFKLYIAIDHVKRKNAVPHYCIDIIKPDPMLVSTTTDNRVYKCRKCRRVLARGLNIIPHSTNEKYSWRNSKWSDPDKGEICEEAYFIEPLEWMQNVTVAIEGKLYCPNTSCRSKIGSFNWITGCQCPCGTKVSPGFYLTSSKIDKQNIVIMTNKEMFK